MFSATPFGDDVTSKAMIRRKLMGRVQNLIGPNGELDLEHNGLSTPELAALLDGLNERGCLVTIRTLNVAGNSFGDPGLSLLAQTFLEHGASMQLEKLCLQNNNISDNETILQQFAQGINNLPRLSRVYLSSNILRDNGVASLLSTLNSRSLRRLQLSMTGLTPACLVNLEEYLISERSRPLQSLRLNANVLGSEGLESMVKILKHMNTSLEEIELFSVGVNVTVFSAEYLLVRRMLDRNKILRRRTASNATALLLASRILLLRAREVETDGQFNDPNLFSFLKLPYELREHILRKINMLGFLSESQQSKIMAYASTEGSAGWTNDCERWLELVDCHRFDWSHQYSSSFRAANPDEIES